MMRVSAAVAVCLLAACGGEGGGGGDCDTAKIAGTYLAEFDMLSGNCAPESSYLTDMVTLQPQFPACSYVENDIDTEACKGNSTIVCSDTANNLSVTITAVLTMDDDDGDVVSGTMTVVVRYLNTGASYCTATHKVTYTRQ
jgi:hypothetical protein